MFIKSLHIELKMIYFMGIFAKINQKVIEELTLIQDKVPSKTSLVDYKLYQCTVYKSHCISSNCATLLPTPQYTNMKIDICVAKLYFLKIFVKKARS